MKAIFVFFLACPGKIGLILISFDLVIRHLTIKTFRNENKALLPHVFGCFIASMSDRLFQRKYC
jgi:hypothetical protein